MELDTLLQNSEPMGTTSNTDTLQSTSTSGQNTLPSTTVNTTPHYTGNTLPNVVVPRPTPYPHIRYTILPTQGGHNPPPYYYVPPMNRQPATHLPPPYSQIAYLPRQQMYPSTYMVPGQILPHQFPQQYRTPHQPLYIQQPQQMSLHSNGSTTGTTQDIDSPVSQEPITIQDTPTQNPPSQTESSTSVNCNSTMAVSRDNNTSIVDVSSTSNPTPQAPAIVAPSITTTTANNSDIETHGAGPNTEETYEMVGGPVVNDDNVYESGEGPPSHSHLYDDTD